jgi:hypothetical protein
MRRATWTRPPRDRHQRRSRRQTRILLAEATRRLPPPRCVPMRPSRPVPCAGVATPAGWRTGRPVAPTASVSDRHGKQAARPPMKAQRRRTRPAARVCLTTAPAAPVPWAERRHVEVGHDLAPTRRLRRRPDRSGTRTHGTLPSTGARDTRASVESKASRARRLALPRLCERALSRATLRLRPRRSAPTEAVSRPSRFARLCFVLQRRRDLVLGEQTLGVEFEAAKLGSARRRPGTADQMPGEHPAQ